ncbi:hypothetical protein FDH70_gp43 [Pseudomonas phage PaMx25]|uniref:Uncharacterized protein n=1 Tax=Pseudomonas phage PaMx25 TaxID=1175654 RepID=A0A0S0N9Z8_9CAUD|nr:hypothetical protein FDH70_gp43 [Pseudomonas phage PaMx25]ALH23787.1 hypothetical protein PaMx25_43 [Pseudomonas phage PaMx25]
MYVSLDMQNMRIVHKHSSVNAVCGLVHIELPDVAVNVCPIDMTVKHKTDMEIKMLFRSCFPGQADHMPVAEMKSKILQFVEEFPVTDLDELEVKRQADSIRDGDKRAYKYVKGSFRASRPAELFADATGDAVRAGATVPASSAARPVRPAAAPRAATGAPRAGGVREKIWAVADRMWEEAGKPTEKSTVLALRKDIMNTLEQDGVKRTSSSNELGNWQKARIA